MSWIDRAERKFGRYAIPRIVRPILAMQALLYVLLLVTNGRMYTSDGINPESLEAKLVLNPGAIMDGEVWRVASFIFVPPVQSAIFFVIGLMFTLFVSESLEQLWGAFRMNVYVIGGMFFLVAGAFMLSVDSYISPGLTSGMLAMSLFLAFAVLFPDYEILAMMVIPIKAKWLGLITAGLLALQFSNYMWLGRLYMIIGLMNFLVFAVPRAMSAYKMRNEVMSRRRRFQEAQIPDVRTFHECKMCGKSEVDDRELDFRVASDGNEYCVPCLKIKRAKEAEEAANTADS